MNETELLIPPNIHKKKESIKTLFFYESTKTVNPNIDCCPFIGFKSLNISDSENTKLIELIKQREVKNIVVLLSSNCKDIDEKLFSKGGDISKPIFDRYEGISGFIDSIKSRQEAEKKLSFYFYAIKKNAFDSKPISLDELIVEAEKTDSYKSVLKELGEVRQRKPQYFIKYNITSSLSNLKKFFGLDSAGYFYVVNKELIKDKDFMFKEQLYAWDSNENTLKIKQPPWAKDYKFIGDSFYKKVESIDAKGKVNGIKLVLRKKDTLKILHGGGYTKFFKDYHYIGFGNVPDNYNYKESHRGYYNRYTQIAYQPKEGKIANALAMIKHVFGEDKITHNGLTLKRYEIALDYLQILVTEPTHPLPILILFSVERETGKSTFPEFIKMILGTNAVKVGNKAFDSEFNEIFADKLLIWCDETLLERKQQAEKIKDLSTSKQILVNPKGTNQYEIPFFGKFIFTSNNKRMVYVDKNSVRFWINEVPPLKKDDPLFIEKLESEIPAFLHFLKQRKLQTERETRMHFNVNWIRTDALEETVKINEPRDVANLRESIKEMFLDIEDNGDEIKMSLTDINNEFFGGRKDKPWIKEILLDFFDLGADNKSPKPTKYSYWKYAKQEKTIFKDKLDGDGKIISTENTGLLESDQQLMRVNKTGRPYIFKRSQFLDD